MRTFIIAGLLAIIGLNQALAQQVGDEVLINGTVKGLSGIILTTKGLNIYLKDAGTITGDITKQEYLDGFDIAVDLGKGEGKNRVISKTFDPDKGQFQVRIRLNDLDQQAVTLRFNFRGVLKEAVLGAIPLEKQTINITMPVAEKEPICVPSRKCGLLRIFRCN
jgi:hypothetical protein